MVMRLSHEAVYGLRQLFLRLAALPAGQRLTLVVVSDIALCLVATALAYMLRVGDPYIDLAGFVMMGGIALFTWSTLALHQRVYRGMMRFFGWSSMARLARVAAIMAALVTTVLLVGKPEGIPRTLGIIQPIIFLFLLVLSRITIAHLLLHSDAAKGRKIEMRSVIVYGVGHSARDVGASVQQHRHMRLVGYFDHHGETGGRELDGVDVWNSDDLEQVLRAEPVDSLFIVSASASRSDRLDIVARVHRILPCCTVKLLPSLSDIANDKVSINDLKEIEINDLLGREPVEPCPDLMASLAGATVLVTGGGGSIGSELCRQVLAQAPARLIIADMSEFALYAIEQELQEAAGDQQIDSLIEPCLVDLSDPLACARLFETYRPDRVLHAAAYKHVPLIEANPVAGVRNNVFSTLNVVREASRNGCKMLTLVSTDKAVRPTNVMGASKRFCELIVQALASEQNTPRMSAVRFGNVLGSSGSVVPKFERQIAAGGPVTITHRDVTRYFMTIPEAASLVIQSGAMAQGGEVFLLDMGEPVRIGDLAHTMIELAGCSVRNANNPDGDIEIVETGLRPGEKLFEELLIDATSMPTRHERIVKANEEMIGWDQLELEIERLRRGIAEHDEQTILGVLERCVAGFSERAIVQEAQQRVA